MSTPRRSLTDAPGRTVLVLAAAGDGEAGLVTGRLAARGGVRVARFDTAAFPAGATVRAELGPAGWEGEIITPGMTIDLARVAGVSTGSRSRSSFLRE